MKRRHVWRFLQISSRYSRSPRSLARVIRAHMPDRHFAGVTEVADPGRAAMGRIAARSIEYRWLQVHDGEPGCAENALIVPGGAKVIYLAAKPVTRRRFKRRGGKLRAVTHAVAAVVEYEDRRVLLSECHTPAGRTPARRLAWTSVQKGWATWIGELEDEFLPDDVICGMDGNRDLFLREWRAEVNRHWFDVGMKLALSPRHMPRKGTFGRRLYDAVIVRKAATVVAVRVVDDTDVKEQSDHLMAEAAIAV